ncbi:MAG: Crp/Fnr family transcriptional regulator [Hymenobacter sp.]|nr:Crp/Fnr family transcriptional regulator [Hymenobacter sp.]
MLPEIRRTGSENSPDPGLLLGQGLAMFTDQLRTLAPDLSTEVVREIAALARPRVVARNDYVQRAGKRAGELVFCQAGLLAVLHPADGKDLVKQFVVEGEFVPTLIGLLEQRPVPEAVRALEDCTLLVWPAKAVRALAATHPGWQQLVQGIIHHHYWFKERRENQLLAHAPQRYYRFLRDACPFVSAGRIPLRYLASYIGVAPETLSRIRARKFLPT